MAVNGVEIKVGQVWRDRVGDVGTITKSCDPDYPWDTGAGATVTDEGKQFSRGTSAPGDLIELISDAPESPEIGLVEPGVTAPGLLSAAASHMAARAATYDKPEGERSMGRAVAAFNAITGRNLSEPEGWLLLQVLKDVRLFTRDGYHADSAEDCIAYAALKAEAKAAEGGAA